MAPYLNYLNTKLINTTTGNYNFVGINKITETERICVR
jgi:hypothetical protein